MPEKEHGVAAEHSVATLITPILMPKWGLSMEEGQIVHWWKSVGDRFAEGEDLVDIETAKVNNVYEAPLSGMLRRIVADVGETVSVGGLMAVSSEPAVSDADIDAFISAFQESFVPEADAGSDSVALTRSRIHAGGHELEVGIAGEGDTVILIHGFSSNSQSWDLNLPTLAQRGRVITIDLPGHGASSKDVREGSLSDLATAVGTALDTLAVGGAHLVGHSLGGAIAMQLTLDRPDRFRSLVLVAPAGLPGGSVNRDFLDGIVDGQRARDLKPWLEMLFHNPDLVSEELIEEVARYKRIDGVEESLSVIRDHLVANGSFGHLAHSLAALPPTLVVLGDDDRIVGSPNTAGLPDSWRVITLNGAGHMPHVERASEFNDVLTSFLDENA
ncbi:acetoin dehydrogenase dihydrolipoyllysine-residue acetyltransferase subunit [Mesorhizobium sp. M0659]|uniref:acetoin dehydrogenase dihydrolipoyllysine-residue acetyltransferase subunit n=1 Tax=Mesorhizobium sp. M0659 TaxID=2956980 RepID=UPI00333903C2